jgi:hypothetical protein
MSIKTIITTIALIAGSSTAALARPVSHPVAVGHGPVVVRDHRQVQARVQPRRIEVRPQYRTDYRTEYRPRIERTFYVAPQPVTYVRPVVTTQGSQYLALGGQVGSGLELALVQGEDQAFVDQVIIHYADGRDVPMHLDRSLNAYDAELQLQTENCAINGVTVIGSGAVTAYRL